MRMQRDDLVVSSAGTKDLAELEELYSEACGYFKFDKQLPLCTPTEFLRGIKYPKTGEPENFEMLTIRLNDMLIGYAMVYRDFPGKRYVELLSLYIGEPARCSGFGTQAAKMICRYFYETGYAAVRVSVSLRNWAALRFWYRLGFDHILSLEADGELANGDNGSISIEKRFEENV